MIETAERDLAGRPKQIYCTRCGHGMKNPRKVEGLYKCSSCNLIQDGQEEQSEGTLPGTTTMKGRNRP